MYQCPECQALLSSNILFLEHVGDHFELAKSAEIFHTSDGRVLNIRELDSPEIFIPRIKLTPYTETCEALAIPSPSGNRGTSTNVHCSDSIQAYPSKRKLRPRRQLKVSEEDSENTVEVCVGESGRNAKKPHVFTTWIPPIGRPDDAQSDAFDVTTRKKGFPCHICGRTLSKSGRLRSHLALHERLKEKIADLDQERQARVCHICDKQFRNKAELERHIQGHKLAEERNKDKPFHCKICPAGFVSQVNLKRHSNIHNADNPFRCKVCNLTTNSKYNLQRHYALHFDELRTTCEICGATTTKGEALRRHMKTVHRGSRLKQEIVLTRCGTRLAKVSMVDKMKLGMQNILVDENGKIKMEADSIAEGQEVTNQSSPSPIEENITTERNDFPVAIMNDNSLGGAYSSNPKSIGPDTLTTILEADAELQRFIRKRIICAASSASSTSTFLSNPFVCKYCPSATFFRNYALRNHVKNVHPEEFLKENEFKDLRLICGTCGFACSGTEELSAHTKSAHPLKWTIRTPRTFKCERCPSLCRTQHSLCRHVQRVHSNPRAQCSFCRKSFATSAYLRAHERRGDPGWCTGESKPKGGDLTCPHCGKETKGKPALARHLLLHAPDRVFSICKLCNERCSDESSLRRHIGLVHGNAKNPHKLVQSKSLQPEALIPEDDLFL